ncbi:sulfurtransferase [Pontibacillus sp. HMF3514]|uniref:sulfurtransferase n=1 Tax=Pontibacillus sp. HMF3514 TaxID=2692425 RepID=UPI00131F8FD8|nr:sulfurtransferase [Pontibacillus sp. HMF3514]QHE51628.1 sulfurtransferase [Pontibacillus sp. HMF3514]
MNIKKKSLAILSLLLGIFIAGCSSNQDTNASSEEEGYANGDLLVEASWVKEHKDDENIQFVDMRGEGFEAGHIPGAVNMTWGDLTRKDYKVDGFLADGKTFTESMQNIGINNDSTVVVYDGGNSLGAARLFYALEYFGHQNVKILNGGYQAWLNAGNEVATGKANPTKGNFQASANKELQSSQEEVKNNLKSDDVVLLDTRSDAEYTGEKVRADRGGHIPGAVHLEWKNSITKNEDGVPVFKSNKELLKQFESAGIVKDKKVVPYCQTNVRGAHTYFTLRLLGYEKVSPYEGSWAQWGNTAEAPIEK